MSDLVDVLIRLMDTGDEVTGLLDLSSRHEHTIRGLTAAICEMTSSQSGIVYCDLPADGPLHQQLDIGVAKKLNWETLGFNFIH